MSPTPRSLPETSLPVILLFAIFFACLLVVFVFWACSKLTRRRDPTPARGIELVLVRTQTPNTDTAPNREQRNSLENQDVGIRYSGATLRESENAGVVDGQCDGDARVPARPPRVHRHSRREEGTGGTASVEGWEMV